MRTATRNLACFALLFLSLTISRGQPVGQWAFQFGGTNTPIWDLTGPYTFDQPMTGAGNLPVPLSYSVFISHDPSGRLHGSGTTFVDLDGQVVAASYRVTGAVSGGGLTTRATISIRLTGRDWISGTPRNFVISTSYRLVPDAETLTLAGRVRGTVKISGLSSAPVRTDAATVALPTGVNGNWNLNMDILPLKRLVGTGAITLSSFVQPDNPGGWPTERILPLKISGSYRTATDVSTLSLTGIGEARPTSLVIKFHTDDPEPFYMRGKVLGQTLRR